MTNLCCNVIHKTYFLGTTATTTLIKSASIVIEIVFEQNQCCGVDGPQDYAIINRDIPVSCCARAYPLREGKARRHLHSTCLTERTYYTRGCEQVVREKEILKSNIIIASSVVFTLLEVSIFLWQSVTKNEELVINAFVNSFAI